MGGRRGGKKGIAKKAGRAMKEASGRKKRGSRKDRLDGGAVASRQGGESEGNRGF